MNNIITLKKIGIAGAIAVVGLALAAGAVFAQSSANTMSLSINNSGSVDLTGTVSLVSGSAISVSSWLGTWVVNVTPTTMLQNGLTLSNIKTGDTVKVSGTLGTGMSINATKVKDSAVSLHNFTGTTSNVNATAQTFTLTTHNKGSYNVVANSNTQIVVNGNLATFGNISNGVQASVFGSLNTTTSTITATTIKIPPMVKSNNKENSEGHGKNK